MALGTEFPHVLLGNNSGITDSLSLSPGLSARIYLYCGAAQVVQAAGTPTFPVYDEILDAKGRHAAET